jgi:thioredoxin 1
MSTVEITMSNYEQTINDNEIVFFDFWAGWCAPCRMFAPVFEKASETHSDIVFGKIDTEAEQQIAGGFGISSIPTLMAFRQGILVYAQPGALNDNQFGELIQAVQDLDMDDVRKQIAEQEQEEAKSADA